MTSAARIRSLCTQYPVGLVGVDDDPIRLTWQIDASDDAHQRRAEIQVARDASFVDVFGEREIGGAAQLAVEAPGDEFASREVRHYRVRADIDGTWTAWSAPCAVEIGLLHPEDWVGEAVTLPDDPGADHQAPAPIVRHEFRLTAAVASARLHVTSLGVHRMLLNGLPVADDLLAPGWSTYAKRLVANTYDVTPLLHEGANAIAGVLGDGWYRGRLGWNPGHDRCNYGEQVALLAQLEITHGDGTTTTIATGPTWKAATGAVLAADIYDGCVIDLRRDPTGWTDAGFDDSSWIAATSVELDTSIIEPRISAPIRAVRELDVELSNAPSGATRVDVGQNISGHLAIDVVGKAGVTVRTHHAEVVESDGSLHLAALRTAEASDLFTLADSDRVTLTPEFTFHGFRYADITTDAEIVGVTAIAISSDLTERGSFSSSHDGLNRLESNVRWSQRDNFVGVPTDCPQRDERLGWTGDAQAFAATADTLFDSHQFWLDWLRDLALDQTDDGVPSVVPDVVLGGEMSIGRAGWADAATIVPWVAYEAYGSDAALAQQFDSMIRWLATLEARRHDDGLLGGGFQFGDWLDPDAPPGQPWKAKTEGDFMANAFFAHSARLTAQAAQVLGRGELATRYEGLADEIALLTWSRWSDHALSTQTGCAVAIELAIAPRSEHPAIAATLARLIGEADGARSPPGSSARHSCYRHCRATASSTRPISCCCAPGSGRGCTRSTTVRRRCGSAGTRSALTARSTMAR